MAVEQATNIKIRSVLDFRKLNHFVECNTGEDFINNCDETLREQKQMNADVSIIDLESAHLQISWAISNSFEYQENTCCLT